MPAPDGLPDARDVADYYYEDERQAILVLTGPGNGNTNPPRPSGKHLINLAKIRHPYVKAGREQVPPPDHWSWLELHKAGVSDEQLREWGYTGPAFPPDQPPT